MFVFCMNRFIILGLVGLLLVGFVSSYICIQPATDNPEVIEFKTNINKLALEQDRDWGLTEEGLRIKLKYFGPCR